jgi:rSAM/selenodomain-associated transferase 1
MNHLIIFIKNPILGHVKTRLAQSIGEEEALIVYVKLLKHTREVVLAVESKRQLYYSQQVADHDLWSTDHFNKNIQKGVDLGDRMNAAFSQCFQEGAEKVVIIGSDCYEIEPGHIEAAYRALGQTDYVIGPAQDGGYYLLGMKRPSDFLFQDIAWSTASVYDDTRKAVLARGFSIDSLETLRDVDHVEDLVHYEDLKQHMR